MSEKSLAACHSGRFSSGDRHAHATDSVSVGLRCDRRGVRGCNGAMHETNGPRHPGMGPAVWLIVLVAATALGAHHARDDWPTDPRNIVWIAERHGSELGLLRRPPRRHADIDRLARRGCGSRGITHERSAPRAVGADTGSYPTARHAPPALDVRERRRDVHRVPSATGGYSSAGPCGRRYRKTDSNSSPRRVADVGARTKDVRSGVLGSTNIRPRTRGQIRATAAGWSRTCPRGRSRGTTRDMRVPAYHTRNAGGPPRPGDYYYRLVTAVVRQVVGASSRRSRRPGWPNGRS